MFCSGSSVSSSADARIAAEVAAQLVHLVQHEHRIVGARPPQRLNDLPRQRADVGAAMSADLRFVVHAAQRNPLELASKRPRNRAAERGLAHARRSDEAQDRPLHVRLQPTHAQVIEDAVLHLLQVVVILVENLLRLDDVHFAARGLRPTAAPPATRCSCASASNRPPSGTCARGGSALSALLS